MSRDPLDGNPFDPKTLNKYLYAGGDPNDALDPSGMGIIESVKTFLISEKGTIIYAATRGFAVRLGLDVLAEEDEGKASQLDIHSVEAALSLCVIGGVYGLLGVP